MNFLMMGAGGVGGYFGARLAAAGAEVGFVARGVHLEAIRARGLAVRSALGDVTAYPARAEADPRALGVPDVVVLAVKLGDTAAALEALAPVVGPGTTVVSLQNGVEAEDMLVRAFGRERAAGGVAYIGAAIAAPGVIRHTGTLARIELGELAGGSSPRIDAVVAALKNARIEAEAVPDITGAIWRKFVFLVGLSATTTLTGRPIGEVRADPGHRAVLAEVMAEAAAVARARGVALPPDFVAGRLAFADTLPADMTSSMAHDAAAGKPLEVAWLSGAVVRLGRELGIETPANRAVFEALKARAAPGPDLIEGAREGAR